MLKYVDTKVTFSEIPDEITLCVNISNCPCKCKGCHSPYLSEDTGTALTVKEVLSLIDNNKGISCICFMGGDSEPEEINILAKQVSKITDIKVAWYSGKQELSKEIDLKNFNYIKLGPYIEGRGPLTSKTTNQRLLAIHTFTNGVTCILDITHLFWKDDKKEN